MRVLVTGAQGCIGSWVTKLLLDRSIETLVYDLDPNPARLSLIAPAEHIRKLRIETGAIEDTNRIKTLVKHEGITHIVHLAAVLIPFCQEHPVRGAITNVIGTLNVFEAARDAGRPIRIGYASSAAVWGPEESYEDRPLSERDPLRPQTHYGVYKQANEGNARVFYSMNGISSIGLRPWTVYGIGRDRGLTADPTIATKAVVLGRPFQIRVTGFMDLQYVEDVADAFLQCLISDLEGAHNFNLSGDIVEIGDFIRMLDELHPGAAKLITANGPHVPIAYKMDDSALREKVPGMRKTPLREGLNRTLDGFERLRIEGKLSPDLA
jgi:nucleoside-diphosphate-sugar epimerase